ncbi:MAG: hypothetical protein CVU57_07785 [Deltaproteobacteria bacterium HGW-Deltaproteobacteria-15]|nr:MAG: hypothetical protein CVU57_07785 [Deltaproteobacteria bacterium HGW-Deltaproteobacteria-15]
MVTGKIVISSWTYQVFSLYHAAQTSFQDTTYAFPFRLHLSSCEKFCPGSVGRVGLKRLFQKYSSKSSHCK